MEDEDAIQEKRGNVDRCKINQYAVDAKGPHLLPVKSLSGADKECVPGAGLNGLPHHRVCGLRGRHCGVFCRDGLGLVQQIIVLRDAILYECFQISQ